ncbi:hypothetical protein HPB50_000635 [Hyalomma asiaticum]|uniref:Uncharacterized protein n=1 Tax=Hyalomma asiaticum TaxID=266040 RepID=A0ACB7T9T5_HYAAI|nr:hypothetical protein HPB50_000635 [Hyalomma asiaticum]
MVLPAASGGVGSEEQQSKQAATRAQELSSSDVNWDRAGHGGSHETVRKIVDFKGTEVPRADFQHDDEIKIIDETAAALSLNESGDWPCWGESTKITIPDTYEAAAAAVASMGFKRDARRESIYIRSNSPHLADQMPSKRNTTLAPTASGAWNPQEDKGK